jgi:hypothetical protein
MFIYQRVSFPQFIPIRKNDQRGSSLRWIPNLPLQRRCFLWRERLVKAADESMMKIRPTYMICGAMICIWYVFIYIIIDIRMHCVISCVYIYIWFFFWFIYNQYTKTQWLSSSNIEKKHWILQWYISNLQEEKSPSKKSVDHSARTRPPEHLKMYKKAMEFHQETLLFGGCVFTLW